MSGFLGSSGNLRAVIGLPDSLARSPALQPFLSKLDLAPGVHASGIRTPDGEALVVVALESFDRLRGARLDAYRVGNWPARVPGAADLRRSGLSKLEALATAGATGAGVGGQGPLNQGRLSWRPHLRGGLSMALPICCSPFFRLPCVLENWEGTTD